MVDGLLRKLLRWRFLWGLNHEGHEGHEGRVGEVLEYESAAKHKCRSAGLTNRDIDDIIDYLCKVSEHRQIHFLWRPFLRDANDDMVLELAVESECDYIDTHNLGDFAGVGRFGVEAITAADFLRKIGELS